MIKTLLGIILAVVLSVPVSAEPIAVSYGNVTLCAYTTNQLFRASNASALTYTSRLANTMVGPGIILHELVCTGGVLTYTAMAAELWDAPLSGITGAGARKIDELYYVPNTSIQIAREWKYGNVGYAGIYLKYYPTLVQTDTNGNTGFWRISYTKSITNKTQP